MNTLTFKRAAVVVAGFLFITLGSLVYAQVPAPAPIQPPAGQTPAFIRVDPHAMKKTEIKSCGTFSTWYYTFGQAWESTPNQSRNVFSERCPLAVNSVEISVRVLDANGTSLQPGGTAQCVGSCPLVKDTVKPATAAQAKNKITVSVCTPGMKNEGRYVVLCGENAQASKEFIQKCNADYLPPAGQSTPVACKPRNVCPPNEMLDLVSGKCKKPDEACPAGTDRKGIEGAQCSCTAVNTIYDEDKKSCVDRGCKTQPECPDKFRCVIPSGKDEGKCEPVACPATCATAYYCSEQTGHECKKCNDGFTNNPAGNACVRDASVPQCPARCQQGSACGQFTGFQCQQCFDGYKPNANGTECIPSTTQQDPSVCTSTSQCQTGPCVSGKCTNCASENKTFTGGSCSFSGPVNPTFGGDCPSTHPHKYNDKCYTPCTGETEFKEGQCVRKQTQTEEQKCQQSGRVWQNGACSQTTPQQLCQQQNGQFQNGICMMQNPNNNNNQNQQAAQQCVQKGGTWANNQCLPGTPNAQQPKPTPQQQQQAAQQAAQQQQQQAQQQCLAQGGQWNGQQCLPPAFNPYTSPYYNQQVAQKPACNFFGASLTEVPLGETVDVTWEVTGASTISLDTSPKSSTKYIKGDASSQANSTLGTITNSINSPLIQPSASQSTIIGATVKPSKKGTLTVRLKVNNLLQNSDPCKPIKLKVVDAAEVSAIETEDTSQNYSATANEQVSQSYLDQGATNNSSGIGEEVELASDIARQKREAAAEVQRNNAEAKPEVTKATYENLCALFGIGCGGGEETAALSNPVETVARGSASTTTPVERLTINPGDVGVDVPNVGSEDGAQAQGGFTTTTQTVYQDGGTTVVAYDPQKATDNAVAGYVQDNAKYAADGIAPQATSNGQLKQEAVTEEATETKKVGVFSRMWGWFMNLIGFGPEQV